MADPTANVEDLEDGEIESDGDDTAQQQEEKTEDNQGLGGNPDNEGNQDQEARQSKSGKKKKSKNKKDKKNKNKVKTYELQDDFAEDIKAIKKAMAKIDEEEEQEYDDERRKRKKRKKYDGKDGPGKKRKKQDPSEDVDESEMMCIRGASPVRRNSGSDYDDDRYSCDSDSSRGSRGQMQQTRQQRQRPNQRDKRNNKNDRRRGVHPMQDLDGVCLYFMQGKCHKGDDCMFSHDAQPPRKMELCKFYLMECCAKRDKCLYMHADFPCKYYHTGLPCIYKEECKFAHGPPLSDNLKNILLKHIESAPKEILGDFPRLNREGAMKMINTTQMKLMQQYSGENYDNIDKTNQIPSLFDLNIPKPNTQDNNFNNFNSDKQNKNSPKVRQSRWQNENLNFSMNNPQETTNILSIKNLTGVLTPKQITDLTKMGIQNLEQLGQLTVLQLNSIGISLKQITEIQLNTMSIQKLGLINNETAQAPSLVSHVTTTKDLDLRVPPVVSNVKSVITSDFPSGDVDMRFTVANVSKKDEEPKSQETEATIDIDQYTKDALNFGYKEGESSNNDATKKSAESNIPSTKIESKDVDHRVLPFSGDAHQLVSNSESFVTKDLDTDIRFLQPEPIFKSPGKRNRRSTTDDDEENNLCIDEKWYSSDEEKGGKKKSISPATSPQLMSPPATPTTHVEPNQVLSKLGDLSKIDISEEVTKLLKTMQNNLHEPNSESSEKPKSRDPRFQKSPVMSPKADSNKGPTKSVPKSPKISIYECVDGEPTDGRRRTDVDLRDYKLPTFGDTDLRQGASGDVDFRLGLPFKPLPNYTPASEIDGSINSHPPINFKLVPIDIPRPDYTDIKNSTAKSQALVDPRLRKVFRLSLEESVSDTEKPSKPAVNAPRVDPRRKPKENDNVQQEQKNSLDLQVVIQNSEWYMELSSTQKIFVNQQIASVTSLLKQFQVDKSAGKSVDLAAILSNSVFTSIFLNLGICLGDNGEFSYLSQSKDRLLKSSNFPQNSGPFGHNSNVPSGMDASNMNMMNMQPMGMGGHNMGGHGMPGFNQPYPDPRGGPTPGLLGIAPNIPHNYGNNYHGPNNFGNMPFNGPGNMDGDGNFPRFPGRGGHRGRGNERWNRGGNRGGPHRKNYNERGGWKNDRH